METTTEPTRKLKTSATGLGNHPKEYSPYGWLQLSSQELRTGAQRQRERKASRLSPMTSSHGPSFEVDFRKGTLESLQNSPDFPFTKLVANALGHFAGLPLPSRASRAPKRQSHPPTHPPTPLSAPPPPPVFSVNPGTLLMGPHVGQGGRQLGFWGAQRLRPPWSRGAKFSPERGNHFLEGHVFGAPLGCQDCLRFGYLTFT